MFSVRSATSHCVHTFSHFFRAKIKATMSKRITALTVIAKQKTMSIAKKPVTKTTTTTTTTKTTGTRLRNRRRLAGCIPARRTTPPTAAPV
jgi:hypothetical protein